MTSKKKHETKLDKDIQRIEKTLEEDEDKRTAEQEDLELVEETANATEPTALEVLTARLSTCEQEAEYLRVEMRTMGAALGELQRAVMGPNGKSLPGRGGMLRRTGAEVAGRAPGLQTDEERRARGLAPLRSRRREEVRVGQVALRNDRGR